MATIVTTSDDESYRNEEANWEYDTPTEGDVREDRISDQTIEERLDQALPSSLDDREVGKYLSEGKEPEDVKESEDVTIHNVDSDEVDEGMSNLIRRAQQKVLPSVWTKKLDSLVRKYKGVWRYSLGPDSPAKGTLFVQTSAKHYTVQMQRASV